MGGFSAFWAGYPHPPISRKLTREGGAVSSERFVGIRPPLPSGIWRRAWGPPRPGVRRAAEVPFRATKAEAARAAQATREVAARAENLLDEYTPNPDGAGPTWEAVLAAHMALDTATRVALQAADQAAKLA